MFDSKLAVKHAVTCWPTGQLAGLNSQPVSTCYRILTPSREELVYKKPWKITTTVACIITKLY